MWPVTLPGPGSRAPSDARTQGALIAKAMGATEDAAARRVIAGREPGERCRLHHWARRPHDPAPSPQGIREDAGPGWPRPAVGAEPGGFDAGRIEPRADERTVRAS